MKKINHGQSWWPFGQDRKIGIRYVELVCHNIDELNVKIKFKYGCTNLCVKNVYILK